ncbi:unnamed protein product [Haemonchus placei]|uniref:Uncharacterized protein n=1 Tax=Haemonchus placei TaxID=6290 RepID=A0A0N4WII7_HAEPC|nr:unnamed protein product [Haemonchus placei]
MAGRLSHRRRIPEPQPERAMPSDQWDSEVIVHYESLAPNFTVTTKIYFARLVRVAAALRKKREVHFSHATTPPKTLRRRPKKNSVLGMAFFDLLTALKKYGSNKLSPVLAAIESLQK